MPGSPVWKLHCRLARFMAGNEIFVSDWQQVSREPLSPTAAEFPVVFTGSHMRGNVFFKPPGAGTFYVEGTDDIVTPVPAFVSPAGIAPAAPSANSLFSVRISTQWVRLRYVNGVLACDTHITAWITED